MRRKYKVDRHVRSKMKQVVHIISVVAHFTNMHTIDVYEYEEYDHINFGIVGSRPFSKVPLRRISFAGTLLLYCDEAERAINNGDRSRVYALTIEMLKYMLNNKRILDGDEFAIPKKTFVDTYNDSICSDEFDAEQKKTLLFYKNAIFDTA